MKQLDLNRYRKQMEAIRLAQAAKDFTPVLFIEVDDAGFLCFHGGDQRFETLFDAEAKLALMAGITNKTAVFYEDTGLVPDGFYATDRIYHNGLYLSADPILYYCSAAERKAFMDCAAPGKYETWAWAYLTLINQLLISSISEPVIGENLELMADENPALKDLIAHRNSISPAEMVLRYQDQKWFAGNKK